MVQQPKQLISTDHQKRSSMCLIWKLISKLQAQGYKIDLLFGFLRAPVGQSNQSVAIG